MINRKHLLKSPLLLSALVAFSTTAIAQTNALAIPPAPAEKYAISAGGVDMRTGQYIYSSIDLQSEGIGAINLTRTTGDPDVQYWNPMGQFTNNWHIYATYRPSKNGEATFTVNRERGQQFVAPNTNNFSVRSVTAMDTLQAIATGSSAVDRYLVYTASDGTKITFRRQGNFSDSPKRLRSNAGQLNVGFFASTVERPDGVKFTLTYDEPGQNRRAFLRRVSSNTGYVLIFEVADNPFDKMVSRACLFNAAVEAVPTSNSCDSSSYQVAYSYSSNGYMSAFADATGANFRFSSTYSEDSWRAALISPTRVYEWTEQFFKPNSTLPYLTNYWYRMLKYGYVKSQDFDSGADYSYLWSIVQHGDAGEEFGEVAGGTASRSDGSNVTIGYQTMRRPGSTASDSYLVSSGPALIIDELGRRLSSDYCATLTVANGVTGCAAVSAKYWQFPEGNRKEYKYTSWGSVLSIINKAKPQSGLSDVSQTFTYDCSFLVNCNKPTSATDGLGNTTTAVYSNVHGGFLKESMPADQSGFRLETRYNYGQVNAWTRSGGVLTASSPLWVVQSEQFCKTSAFDANGECSGGASDEVRTIYEYENGGSSKGSNVRLIGRVNVADGVVARTCLTYDKWGRKVSETKPNANLSACS